MYNHYNIILHFSIDCCIYCIDPTINIFYDYKYNLENYNFFLSSSSSQFLYIYSLIEVDFYFLYFISFQGHFYYFFISIEAFFFFLYTFFFLHLQYYFDFSTFFYIVLISLYYNSLWVVILYCGLTILNLIYGIFGSLLDYKIP